MTVQNNPYWYYYVRNTDPKSIQVSIEEKFLNCGNKRIHLDIYNTQNHSPTLIFIHGTTVNGKFNTELLYSIFKSGIRVVALDLQGHGLSSGVRGHFTVNELGKNVRCVTDFVIDTYGKEVAVMGSSLGGITAFYAAASDNRLKTAICNNFAVLSENAQKEFLNYPRFSPS